MIAIDTKPLLVETQVKTAEVDKIIGNYKKERWVHNTERIGKEDSLSAWWSIEQMEQFIEEAKINGADGLKFYFGAYGANNPDEPLYADRQTLVMVGTKEKQTERGIKNKDVYVSTENGYNILANLPNQICPPKCGAGGQISPDDNELGVVIIDKGECGFVVV